MNADDSHEDSLFRGRRLLESALLRHLVQHTKPKHIAQLR
jgi:hypothetical protein